MRHAHRLLFDVFLRHFTSQFLATSPGMVSASCVALALCHLAAAQDFEQGKALWATQCAR